MSALLGYSEFEQAVLLTELLFKSTNAGHAGSKNVVKVQMKAKGSEE